MSSWVYKTTLQNEYADVCNALLATEYCERVRFSVKVYYNINGMKKIISLSGISDIKIGQKSGNSFTDFLHYTGNFKRDFSVYSNRCTQTKVSDKVFRLCWNGIQYRHFRYRRDIVSSQN